ncbi:MAG: hypothetical protein MK171_07030 [Pirellulales bacterium]|nr:hypothetical protein [Pirellulales bacterium]
MYSLTQHVPRGATMRGFSLAVQMGLLALGAFIPASAFEAEGQGTWAEQIEKHIGLLNDADSTVRDQAEQALVKLAPTENVDKCDAFLAQLPKPVTGRAAIGMPAEVRLRLARIRRQIEVACVEQDLAASRLTVSTSGMALDDLLKEVHRQTGNRLTDYRERFGQEATRLSVAIDLHDESFWSGMDKILDQASLGLYPYSGEESLAVINRPQGANSRAERASYAGPFRIEAVNIVTQRNLRLPDQQGARAELEIAWEPRLRPIAISQSAESLVIIANDGSPVRLADDRKIFSVEVQPGSHATELRIPFVLPQRSVSTLASLEGQMSALVPGRVVEFRFEDLAENKRVEQQHGGVKVGLTAVRKNQQFWEVHMRLTVEGEEPALESHRGWVFQNLSYLLNDQGEMIDHAGFETTMQTKREIGLAYLFDLPDEKIDRYTWVYRTPAAILRMSVKFKLKDIRLP